MQKLHQHYLGRYVWYKEWHKNPMASPLHWLVFILVAFLTAASLISFLTSKPSPTLAANWVIQEIDGGLGIDVGQSLSLGPKDRRASVDNVTISYRDVTNGDLKAADFSNNVWQTYTIDSTGDVGIDTSLDLYANGLSGISYYDLTNGDLKYVYFVGVGGNCLGGQAQCDIIDSTGNVGRASSLQINTADIPSIAYFDATNTDLKLASLLPGGNCGPGGNTWQCDIIDAAGAVGSFTSFRNDPLGNGPRIAYYDATNNSLKYAYRTGNPADFCDAVGGIANWLCEAVDTPGGTYPSLAFTSTGTPGISYYDANNTDLKYASPAAPGLGDCGPTLNWLCQIVDANVGLQSANSLSFDENNNPGISYYDAINQDLKFALWTGTAWQIETVEAAGNVGQFNALVLGTVNNRELAYYDATNGLLKFATYYIDAPPGPSPILVNPPAVPSNCTGQAINSSTIEWTFIDNADNETGFKVLKPDYTTAAETNTASPATGGQVTLLETGLSPDTLYSGRKAIAYNNNGQSTEASCSDVRTLATPVYQCSDGIDNDQDGLIDFPADPGCTDASDNDETDPLPICGNSVLEAGEICDPPGALQCPAYNQTTRQIDSNAAQCEANCTCLAVGGPTPECTSGDSQADSQTQTCITSLNCSGSQIRTRSRTCVNGFWETWTVWSAWNACQDDSTDNCPICTPEQIQTCRVQTNNCPGTQTCQTGAPSSWGPCTDTYPDDNCPASYNININICSVSVCPNGVCESSLNYCPREDQITCPQDCGTPAPQPGPQPGPAPAPSPAPVTGGVTSGTTETMVLAALQGASGEIQEATATLTQPELAQEASNISENLQQLASFLQDPEKRDQIAKKDIQKTAKEIRRFARKIEDPVQSQKLENIARQIEQAAPKEPMVWPWMTLMLALAVLIALGLSKILTIKKKVN